MSDNHSTPISEIMPEENNDLVQEIINEIQMQEQTQETVEPQENLETNNLTMNQPVQEHTSFNVLPSNHNDNVSTFPEMTKLDKPIKKNDSGLMKKMLSFQKLKTVLLVTSIIFVLSLPFVNKILIKTIPKISNENQINLLGLVLKSIIGGIVYYLSSVFI